MTRKKANITQADIDTYYTDGDNVYQLVGCETEPHAMMRSVSQNLDVERTISGFANFVRLKPEHPITKPTAPRKPRKDKGTTRRKQNIDPLGKYTAPVEAVSTVSITQVTAGEAPVIRKRGKKPITKGDSNSPDISTFSVSVGQGDELHQVRMGAQVVGCKTLREGATQLLAKWGIDQQYVADAPSSEGKDWLLSILKEDKIDA